MSQKNHRRTSGTSHERLSFPHDEQPTEELVRVHQVLCQTQLSYVLSIRRGETDSIVNCAVAKTPVLLVHPSHYLFSVGC